jgi:hypothetical protein
MTLDEAQMARLFEAITRCGLDFKRADAEGAAVVKALGEKVRLVCRRVDWTAWTGIEEDSLADHLFRPAWIRFRDDVPPGVVLIEG